MFERIYTGSRIASLGLALACPLTHAAAPGSNPLPPGAKVSAMPQTAITSMKLISTFVNYAPNLGLALPTGFNDLSTPLTVKCPNAAGCTIVSTVTGQIAPPAGTMWAFCVLVDGAYSNPPCPYQGTLPAVGQYISGTGTFISSVATGTHTVVPQIYVSTPSELTAWTLDVSSYK